MSKQDGAKKALKKIFKVVLASFVLLFAIAFAGYLVVQFQALAYIPGALSVTLIILCVVFACFSIGFYVAYLKELFQK